MQNLIEFFEKETNKKINIFQYNGEILKDNQTLVTFMNQTYIIESVEENNLSNINGYTYLFYQYDLDFYALQDIFYNLYNNIQVIKYDKYVLLISSEKLEIDASTPEVLESETYRNTYIVFLDKIENKDSLISKIDIVNKLLPIIIKDSYISKYIDLYDLIIYKTIDLTSSSSYFSDLISFENLNTMDDNLLHTGLNFIENGLNISKTSNALFLHRNTLIYRLEKIKEILNLDLKIFKEALVFYLSVKSYFYTKNNNT